MKRIPWTSAELDALIPKIEARLAEAESSQEEQIKPFGPMTVEEAKGLLNRLMDHARERPLTSRECFMHGLLLAVYEHAVKAEMLGKKGQRYFVFSKEQIDGLLKAEGIR